MSRSHPDRSRNRLPRRLRRRGGYVLLMTLLSIAIASTVLIGFAQFSLNHAVESRMLEEELQRKWGAASLQRVSLEQSTAVLNPQHEDDGGRVSSLALAHVSTRVQLGDVQFDIHIHDESSKLDVNQVLDYTKNSIAAKRVLREVADRSEFQLQPLKKESRRTLKEDPFECWDQVFATENGPMSARETHAATSQLTCWSRQLNYKTASDDVLFEVCKMVAGQAAASQLVSFRENNSTASFNQALGEIHIAKAAAQKLRNVLVESSQSQAIWIHASDSDTDTSHLVIRESISGVQRFTSFQW